MLERKSERIESISAEGSKSETFFDLSGTGVSCLHPKPKGKNSYVEIKINNLLLRAKVIYCQKRDNGYRLGLQFWNVQLQHQKELDELVEKYSKGVPVQCSIVEETNPASHQDTKKIITKNMTKKKDPDNG